MRLAGQAGESSPPPGAGTVAREPRGGRAVNEGRPLLRDAWQGRGLSVQRPAGNSDPPASCVACGVRFLRRARFGREGRVYQGHNASIVRRVSLAPTETLWANRETHPIRAGFFIWITPSALHQGAVRPKGACSPARPWALGAALGPGPGSVASPIPAGAGAGRTCSCFSHKRTCPNGYPLGRGQLCANPRTARRENYLKAALFDYGGVICPGRRRLYRATGGAA